VNVAVLAGGVGAARLLRGMVRAVDPASVTAIVNVGDDLELHGLYVCPDLDTVVYTVADAIDTERGWGLAGETWRAMASLDRYGGEAWFNLGDADLGTHLYRTERLAAGARLSQVVCEIANGWGVSMRMLPVTDDRLRTFVTIAGEGEVSFQDYFVRRRHAVAVSGIRFEGADDAHPAPGVLEALATADHVVIAPSNPVVSIGPVLAVKRVRDAVVARRADVTAISPIVAGKALKGPADRLLRELGHEPSVVGVARLYRDVVSRLVIDEADATLADDVRAEGIECIVAPTIMRDIDTTIALARVAIS
jgi:LPPG:FO 2-phospho-L-lactate transferase